MWHFRHSPRAAARAGLPWPRGRLHVFIISCHLRPPAPPGPVRLLWPDLRDVANPLRHGLPVELVADLHGGTVPHQVFVARLAWPARPPLEFVAEPHRHGRLLQKARMVAWVDAVLPEASNNRADCLPLCALAMRAARNSASPV